MVFHVKTPKNLVKFYDETSYGIEQVKDIRKTFNNLSLGSRILDLGCGYGIPATIMKAYGFQVYACDIDNGNIETSKEIMWSMDIPFMISDTNSLPYQTEFFDAVMMYAVWEHVKPTDKDALLSECRRVLKPGGKLFIFRAINKNSFAEYLARKMQLPNHGKDVVTSIESLRNFKNTGFEVLESGMQGWLPENVGIDKWVIYSLNRLLCRLPFVKRFGHAYWWVLQKKG